MYPRSARNKRHYLRSRWVTVVLTLTLATCLDQKAWTKEKQTNNGWVSQEQGKA